MERYLIKGYVKNKQIYFFQWCLELADIYLIEKHNEAIRLWLACADDSLMDLKKENIQSEFFNQVNRRLNRFLYCNNTEIQSDAAELKKKFCRLYWS